MNILFTLDKVRTTSKQMSPGRLAVDCETVETYKQDPDGSKDSAKRRVGSAFQTGTIFHYVVKKKKPSAQCIPKIYGKCKRLHYHMLWPKGTCGRRT